MTNIPSQIAPDIPDIPYESEDGQAWRAGRVLRNQRNDKLHGLPESRDVTDNPVHDTRPFKNLRSE